MNKFEINNLQLLTILAKGFILDVLRGFEYTSVSISYFIFLFVLKSSLFSLLLTSVSFMSRPKKTLREKRPYLEFFWVVFSPNLERYGSERLDNDVIS